MKSEIITCATHSITIADCDELARPGGIIDSFGTSFKSFRKSSQALTSLSGLDTLRRFIEFRNWYSVPPSILESVP